VTKDSYVDDTHALTCHAYIKDGVWREKGNMGWWAIVTDEQPGDIWQGEVDAMIASLDPEDWITIVDCHI
jgi:hypothetical protein